MCPAENNLFNLILSYVVSQTILAMEMFLNPPHVHLFNLHDLLVVVLWKVLYETVCLHDVFRVRGPVTNRLRTVLLQKQRLKDGVKEQGQCLG